MSEHKILKLIVFVLALLGMGLLIAMLMGRRED